MLIATWNIHGFQDNKIVLIEEVVQRNDFVCLTETWDDVPQYDDWQTVNCISRATHNSGPSCGGVALMVQRHFKLKVRHKHVYKHIQSICSTIMTVPL